MIEFFGLGVPDLTSSDPDNPLLPGSTTSTQSTDNQVPLEVYSNRDGEVELTGPGGMRVNVTYRAPLVEVTYSKNSNPSGFSYTSKINGEDDPTVLDVEAVIAGQNVADSDLVGKYPFLRGDAELLGGEAEGNQRDLDIDRGPHEGNTGHSEYLIGWRSFQRG